jgi:hypothetical protein
LGPTSSRGAELTPPQMRRGWVVASCLLVAGCSTDAIQTSQQAEIVAQSSECAAAQVELMDGEKMPTGWVAEHVGDKWHAWLPPDPSGPDAKGAWIKGAWINAKDGQIELCQLRMFGPSLERKP